VATWSDKQEMMASARSRPYAEKDGIKPPMFSYSVISTGPGCAAMPRGRYSA